MTEIVDVHGSGIHDKKKRSARGQRRYRRTEQAHANSVADSSSAQTSTPGWEISRVAGGIFWDKRAVFSQDSSHFFCICGSRLKVYNSATAIAVRTFQLPRTHGGAIFTDMQIDGTNAKQLFSTSTDGVLRLWNIETGSVIESWEIGEEITHARIHPSDLNHMYLITRASDMSEKGSHKQPFTFNVVRFGLRSFKKKVLMKTKQELLSLEVGQKGGHMAVVSKTMFALFEPSSTVNVRRYQADHDITSLAVHPTECCIAVGDCEGHITLWRFANGLVGEPVQTSMHWHPHQVNCLAFTPDGSHLLSGGNETVLVVWQLATGHKEFLPRLGSAISTVAISPDQSLYLLTHRDNSLRLISPVTMSVKTTIYGLNCAHEVAGVQISIQPKGNAVVLKGPSDRIQFFDLLSDQSVYQVEATPSDIGSSWGNRNAERSSVTHVAFSYDGSWMATAHGHPNEGDSPIETYLKFWELDHDSGRYRLHTRIDGPHHGTFNGLDISPVHKRCPGVATIGGDTFLRIWQPDGALRHGNEDPWRCWSTASYQNLEPEQVLYSVDGSLIAVAYRQVIALWDETGNELRTVFTVSSSPFHVRRMKFAGDAYLITCTDRQLHVWHLLRGTLWWTVPLTVRDLAVEYRCRQFVVLAPLIAARSKVPLTGLTPVHNGASLLLTFDVGSPIPVSTSTFSHAYRAIAYLRNTSTDLIMLTDNGELQVLTDRGDSDAKTSSINTDSRRHDALSSLYPAPPVTKTLSALPSVPQSVPLLHAPSYIHPAPALFYASNMQFALARRVNATDHSIEVPMKPAVSLPGRQSHATECLQLEEDALQSIFWNVLLPSH